MKNDNVVLFEIIDKFSNEMFNLEKLDITTVSTISSILLKIYLTNYYDEKKTPLHIPIPILS
jgi:hypothetical protein